MTEKSLYVQLQELDLLAIEPRPHDQIADLESPRRLFEMVHEASARASILVEQSMSSADTVADDELTAMSVYWAQFYQEAQKAGNESVANFVKEIIFDLVLSDIPESYLKPPAEN